MILKIKFVISKYNDLGQKLNFGHECRSIKMEFYFAVRNIKSVLVIQLQRSL